MRVFVTGGSGLVGSHVIQQLRARGDEVLALARTHRAAAASGALGAIPLSGDAMDPAVLERGVMESDASVHAAAIVLSKADWAHHHAANVVPTEVMARAAARSKRRLVHVSSVAVYGRRTTYDGGPGSVTEDFGMDSPIFPGDHYARSKREAEQAVWRVRDELGLAAVCLRPNVIYGEGDRAFGVRVAASLRRGLAPLFGPGDNPMSIVYAGNVAAAVLAALDRPAVTGAFNVTNDGVITQRDFIRTFARGLGVTVCFVRIPLSVAWPCAKIADGAIRLVRPSAGMMVLKTAIQFLSAANPFVSTRAERELGWKPLIGPPDTVLRTARWYRDAHAA